MSSDKSVGQIVGTVIGAVVGYFVPPVGIAVGAAVGNAVGGLVDPPKGPTIEGPRLGDLSVQTAQFGAPLRRLYGTLGTSGNVIWVENNAIREVVRKKKQGGKGGSSSTVKTYTYFATFAVALGDGEIEGIGRVWINGTLVYNALSENLETIVASNRAGSVAAGGGMPGTTTGSGGVNFRVYTGTDDQMPDPRIEAEMGLGNTPAFRGVPYIVFYDLDLTPYGNTLMGAQVKVELIGKGATSSRFIRVERLTAADSGLSGRGHCSNVVDTDFRSWVMTDFPTPTESGTLYSVSINGRRRQESVPNVATSSYKFSVAGLSNRARWWLSHDAVQGSNRTLLSDLGSVVIPTGRPARVFDIADTGTYCLYQHNDPVGDDRIVKINTDTLAWFIETTLAPGFSSFGMAVGGGLVALLRKTDSTTLAVRLYDADLDFIREFSVAYPTYPVGDGLAATIIGSQLVIAANSSVGSIGGGQLVLRQIDIGSSALVAEHEVEIPTPVDTISQPQPALGFSDGVFVFSQREPDEILSIYYFQLGAMAGNPIPLADVVEQEMRLSEHIRPEDIDVSLLAAEVRGYGPAGIQQLRNCIGPLQTAYPFDIVPSGYQIKAVPRGAGSVATIPIEHLDARPYGDAPGVALDSSKEMDTQLPRKVLVRHIDAEREYDMNQQASPERQGGRSADAGTADLALVLTPDEGAGIAEMQLYRQWLERDDIAFRLPPIYGHLEPADVITVDAGDAQYELILRAVQYRSDGVLECSAKPNAAATYTPAAVGGQGPVPNGDVALLSPSELLMLDIPLILNEDDEPLFASAVAGTSDSWPGAVLFRSADNEQTWQDVQAFSGPVTLGYARDPLAVHDGLVIDRASALVVDMVAGEPEAITEAQMMTGRNWVAYGADQRWELMRFAGCVLQADGSYALSILARGSRGSEWATGLHQQGDALVLLDDADLAAIGGDLQQLNAVLQWRASTVGMDVAEAESVPFAYRGVNLRPVSAVHGSAVRVANDWNLAWTRRTRLNGSLWTTGIELPLGEASESWQIDILNGSVVVRTLTSATGSVTYTEADQITDFGSAQSSISARVYQMSATVGRGYPLEIAA